MNLTLLAKNYNCASKLLLSSSLKHFSKYDAEPLLKSSPFLLKRHHGLVDHIRIRIGKREIVGFGLNGSPVYLDVVEYPMPAVRFREPTPEIEALREREKGDWNNLSLDEKKKLYRYSFCQTFAEMTAPTGFWKYCVGVWLWALAVALSMSIVFHSIREPLPESFKEDSRQQQLKRIISLQMNPVNGISSKWDYEVGDWKSKCRK